MVLAPQVQKHIESLLREAEDGKLVHRLESVRQLLKEAGLAMQLKLKPDWIGVHEHNRDGLGCSVHQVQSLLKDIAAIGWTPSKCNPMCIESGQNIEQDRAFNRN